MENSRSLAALGMTCHSESATRLRNLLFLGFALTFMPAAAAAQGRIVVGSGVMVSAAQPGWEHTEYAADADPSDSTRVLVCVMRFSQATNRLTSGIYTSFDGGLRWALAHVDSSSAYVGDPACAYGLGGSAVFVALATPDTAVQDTTILYEYERWGMGGDEVTHLFRSPDGGRTWALPVKMSFFDRENLQVDHTAGPYRGRMYMHGWGQWDIYSTDSGQTWQKSAKPSVQGREGNMSWPATILPDGTLLLVGSTTVPSVAGARSELTVLTSTDGGAHLEPVVATGIKHCDEGVASDHSTGPFGGRVYIVCGQFYKNRTAYYVMHSDDKGKTWSPPVRATDPRAARTQVHTDLLPQLAVNRDGIVGLAWYDFGAEEQPREGHLRFTASLDGGETWLASAVVSAQHPFRLSQPPTFAAFGYVDGGGRRQRWRRPRQRADSVAIRVWPSPRSYYLWNSAPGDYAEMAAGADGVFHAFWIGTHEGVGELYTARISVEGAVNRRGEGELTGFENVTSKLEFQVVSSVWNPRSSTFSLAYRMLNTSPDTLCAPLKVQIARLESDLGVPTIELSRGRTASAGAVLDVSDALPDGGFAPQQKTAPIPVRVKLDDVGDLTSSERARDALFLVLKAYGAPLRSSRSSRQAKVIPRSVGAVDRSRGTSLCSLEKIPA
jgi:hypothetical protein